MDLLGENAMPFRLAAWLVLLALIPPQASAQEQGSPKDQDACRPDVFRLCTDVIPDESRIVACLNAKANDLSPACRAVIDPPARAPRKRKKVKLTGLQNRRPLGASWGTTRRPDGSPEAAAARA